MVTSMFLEYGYLRPLSYEELAGLHLGMGRFEEMSDLDLAPYLLDTPFVERLADKTSRMTGSPGEISDWDVVWGVVLDEDLVVGFLDFDEEPTINGRVTLRWTVSSEWVSSDLAGNAVRRLVAWAFQRSECLSVVADETFRPLGEMERNLKRIGFRRISTTVSEKVYRLDKVVEGHLL